MYVSIVNVVLVCVRGGRNGLGDGTAGTDAQIPTGDRRRGGGSDRRTASCTTAGVEMRQERFRNARMRFCLLLEHRFGLRGKKDQVFN